ncbi:MAG: hypothetical protein JWQ90_4040 [Hydrocarboniphaga sp.]|uniref:invasin domain 3-containing protein n=1 Tax=Hydrocarboniphaga sp. TaxID=2033016 RepID=UPI002606A41B|nr:invasin domain 3-containing protein [Hydrocarboniphaga sp.]MDB5971590.1 hypothetical protein [Hydrocarboniphaga sp.]
MTLGHLLRGSSFAVLLLLSACGSSDSGGGLLDNDPGTTTPTLTLTGPDSVASGTSQSYTVTALDAAGDPVTGVSITLSASLGTLSRTTTATTTNSLGQLYFTLSATTTSSSGTVTAVTGTSSVIASGTVGGEALSATKAVAMTPTVFQFTAPLAAAKLAVNTVQPLVLQWAADGVAVSAPVTFTATLGTLIDAAGNAGSSLTVTTDSSGFARLQITSSTSGAETVTAVSDTAEFSATRAFAYVGEPAAFTFAVSSPISATSATSGASTISVKVSDASTNTVAGATVAFAISSAPSAGTLSPSTATTNASGIATAIYRANGGAGTALINITVGSLPVQTATIKINP